MIGHRVKQAPAILFEEQQDKKRKQKIRRNTVDRIRNRSTRAAALVDQKVEKVLTDMGKNPLTPPEQKAIAQIIPDAPIELYKGVASPRVQHLALQKAREQFQENAIKYVNLHLSSAQAAKDSGEFGVATKAAEWALDNVGEGKQRVTEPTPKTQIMSGEGPKIVVGVHVGGLTPQLGGDE